MSAVAQVNANQGTPVKGLIGRLVAGDEKLAQGQSVTGVRKNFQAGSAHTLQTGNVESRQKSYTRGQWPVSSHISPPMANAKTATHVEIPELRRTHDVEYSQRQTMHRRFLRRKRGRKEKDRRGSGAPYEP